jgi:hypothetical protein
MERVTKCITCGAGFDAPAGILDCLQPSPGRPYIDTGKGNHIFRPVCLLCNGFGLDVDEVAHYNCRRHCQVVLDCLASNLLTAAALCEAHRLGFDDGVGQAEEWEGYTRSNTAWHPGCGYAAPRRR